MPTSFVPPAPTSGPSAARWVLVVLGSWLFLSAFAWPHTGEQLTNAWLVGGTCVAITLGSMAAPRLRYFNTLLSAWLLVSAYALPHLSAATMWNNALVALAMFVTSLMPSGPVSGTGPLGSVWPQTPQRAR